VSAVVEEESPAAGGRERVRTVIEPDLLWVESVTERLLGPHAGLNAQLEQEIAADRARHSPVRPPEHGADSGPVSTGSAPPPPLRLPVDPTSPFIRVDPTSPFTRVSVTPAAPAPTGTDPAPADVLLGLVPPPAGQPSAPGPAAAGPPPAPPASDAEQTGPPSVRRARHAAPAPGRGDELLREALRLALHSNDPAVVATVARLVGDLSESQAQRRRLEGWLDLVLDEVGEQLPGAPLLRSALGSGDRVDLLAAGS
jgi:hypothetical protein